ncbi:MAG: hypothetical protein ACREAC_18095, partial [Blastocatellia bacterium]
GAVEGCKVRRLESWVLALSTGTGSLALAGASGEDGDRRFVEIFEGTVLRARFRAGLERWGSSVPSMGNGSLPLPLAYGFEGMFGWE